MFSKELFQTAVLALSLGIESASAMEWEYNLTALRPHMRRMVEGELALAQKGLIAPFGQSSNREKIHGSSIKCDEKTGMAGEFPCMNVDLLSFTPDADLVSDPKFESKASDNWGWENPEDGKEWVIHTTRSGYSFVDISDPTKPVPVAFLPRTGTAGTPWSDVKIYKDHAYMVADASPGQFMHVVDLKRVAALKPQSNGKPVQIKEDVHFTGGWKQGGRGGGSAHNIVINEETGFAYLVGADGCPGNVGIMVVNIQDPKEPKFESCFADKESGGVAGGIGYIHDSQCLIYRGPDKKYQGRELCFNYNEVKLVIYDVEDKQNIRVISAIGYEDVAYCHQGWLNDGHTHLLMNDELDEIKHPEALRGGRTRTLIWDVTNLDKPVHTGDFLHAEVSVDHNLYIRDNIGYLSNYVAGLKVLDLAGIKNPKDVKLIGKFDSSPEFNKVPGPGVTAVMAGAWNVYPYFKSEVLALSNIDHGLFLIKRSK